MLDFVEFADADEFANLRILFQCTFHDGSHFVVLKEISGKFNNHNLNNFWRYLISFFFQLRAIFLIETRNLLLFKMNDEYKKTSSYPSHAIFLFLTSKENLLELH